MLIEIQCELFRTGAVRFHEGLNVVLGDENATNSIGKSTILMIIDFVLGGDTFISHNADVVHELGHHTYEFAFSFPPDILYFARGTEYPNSVSICDANYEVERTITIDEYRALLHRAYGIQLHDLTFRSLVGLYFRVWGKSNLSLKRPLHTVPEQGRAEAVDTLLKTFDRFDSIRDLSAELHALQGEKKAVDSAVRYELLPASRVSDYKRNENRVAELQAQLEEIQTELSRYTTGLSAVISQEILELKLEKEQLFQLRLPLEGRLHRMRQNLAGRRRVRAGQFSELKRYFPGVDVDRLMRVEEFHDGVSALLSAELAEAGKRLEEQLARIDAAIADVDRQIARVLDPTEQPTVLVDRVYKVSRELEQARESNRRIDMVREVRDRFLRLRTRLAEEKRAVIREVEAAVNGGMRAIVDEVFGPERKSPQLRLEPTDYSFEVYDDTGTGTAYVSLVILDLTVFLVTALPVIGHDSLLFKNIENASVAHLMEVYLRTSKQSFVALDEIDKYGPSTSELLRSRCVLHLDNEHLLYVKDWRSASRGDG